MEIAKLVLEYLRSIIWPAVTCLIVVVFRNELTNLLARLNNMELPGGAKFNFSKAVEEVEKAAKEIEAKNAITTKETTPIAKIEKKINDYLQKKDLYISQSNYNLSYYLKLAESDPNLAMAGLRMELERMFTNMLILSNINIENKKYSAGVYLNTLSIKELIPSDQYYLLKQTLNIANESVHNKRISSENAIKVIESVAPFFKYYLSWIDSKIPKPKTRKAPTVKETTK